jgi:hypothetical protein
MAVTKAASRFRRSQLTHFTRSASNKEYSLKNSLKDRHCKPSIVDLQILFGYFSIT